MDPAYGQRYRELFERHWWWRARNEIIVETLRRLPPPAGGWRRILDVGCGDGLFFPVLSAFGAAVEGVEPDSALVTDGSGYRDRIHLGPFDGSFGPPHDYDLIVMLDVLEHIADPVGALRRVVDLLAPEGIYVATVPAFPHLWTRHDEINHHYTRYTKASFRAVAESAGLRIEHAEYFLHWMWPAKLAVRLVERFLPSPPAVPGIPPPWMNRSLYGLSRLERLVLRRFPIPFGSSLLVVARRATP